MHSAAGLKPSSFLVVIVPEQKHHDMEIWLCTKASAVPSFVRTRTHAFTRPLTLYS